MTDSKPQGKAEPPQKDQGKARKGEAAQNRNTRSKGRRWFEARFSDGVLQYGLELISDGISFIVIWMAALAILMSRGTVDLTPFKPRIEQSLSHAFGGETADIAQYRASWLQERQTIELRADQIAIKNEGQIVQNVDSVRAEFSIYPHFLAKPKLSSIAVDGGAVTIERFSDGDVQFGLGTPGKYRPIGPKFDSATLRSLLSSEGGQRADLGQFKFAKIQDGAVHFVDHVLDGAWVMMDLNGDVALDAERFELQVDGKLSDPTLDSQISIAFSSDQSLADMHGVIKTIQVNPKSIAPRNGELGLLPRLDAPVDLDLNFAASRENGLKSLALKMKVDAGSLLTGTTYKPFENAEFSAIYRPEVEVIDIDHFSLDSLALKTTGRGSLRNFGTSGFGFLKTPVGFDVALDSTILNAGMKFDNLISAKSASFTGDIDFNNNILALDTAKVDFGSFQTDLSLKITSGDTGLSAVSGDGRIVGGVTTRQLLDFWPNQFSISARNWVERSIQAGTLFDIEFKANIDAQDLATRQIANEHLHVAFDFDGADVRYMQDMPWLREANGYGVLQGNQIDVYVSEAQVERMAVRKGEVHIPHFLPKGGDLNIQLTAAGTVDEMLRVCNFPPFEFPKMLEIDPKDYAGHGVVDLKVSRPLGRGFQKDEVRYDVVGDFQDVVAPMGSGDLSMKSGAFKFKANNDGMSVFGPMTLASWPAVLDWRKTYAQGNLPAQYTLKGTVSRSNLDDFGIGFRKHFGGEIDLTLSGVGDTRHSDKMMVEADFKHAEVNFGTLWNKPLNVPGTLSAGIDLRSGAGYRVENVQVDAPGLTIRSRFDLEPNLKLKTIDASLVKIDDFLDLSLKGTPTKDGVMTLSLSGAFLNVEPWVDDIFKRQSNGINVPILLTADLKRLILKPGYVLTNAAFVFATDGTIIEHARLKGQHNSLPFLTEVTRDEGSGQRRIKVDIPDAGAATAEFFGLDDIRGGTFTLHGLLPRVDQERRPATSNATLESGALNGQVILKNFDLVHAPAFAQILSIASLSGLADTLSGSGLHFETTKFDFSLENGMMKIRDGRANGPALGLTGAGDVSIAQKNVDFNGVIVPSYTMNSLLGDIPLLGDIIVGKKGEGMFAINYTIKGPFSKMQVNVNPLSALTPGFLRRIFDVKRDDVSDPVLEDLIKAQEQKKEN